MWCLAILYCALYFTFCTALYFSQFLFNSISQNCRIIPCWICCVLCCIIFEWLLKLFPCDQPWYRFFTHFQEELVNLKTIQNSLAVFCLATYGEGDPTDNAMEFYEWLKNGDADLTGLNYAVSKIHVPFFRSRFPQIMNIPFPYIILTLWKLSR